MAEFVTNPLDKQQQQLFLNEENTKHWAATMARLVGKKTMSFAHPRMRSASIRQLDNPYRDGSLNCRPPHQARSLREPALRERDLQPCIMSLNRYIIRLDRQTPGAPVAFIKGVLIFLFPGKDE